MNYPPPQGGPGYPPYGSPSPQPGYGAPPPVPNHPYQNQGYGAPSPNQYPPNQQYPPIAGYGQAAPPYPPQPYPPQQPQGYAGYPPGPQYPPQQPYGQPPTQPGYGAPPNAYAPPPPAQYPYAQPQPPSPGYIPNASAPYDATSEAQALRRAMKGIGTDEKALIRVLCRPDALSVATIRSTYTSLFSRSLENDIAKETSGYFKETLLAIVRGPLAQDVHALHKSLAGAGTNEDLLNDVLLSRSNADINAIKAAYANTYHIPLEKAVSSDLSLKTARLFAMVLNATRAEPSAPINPQQTTQAATELHRAMEGRSFGHGTDALEVCRLFTTLSDPQLAAVAASFEQSYASPLRKVLRKHFSGHMEDALLYILDGATDRAMRDARLLEDSMKGAGTKDVLLLNRIVRAHWDRQHLENVKGAYRVAFKGKDLIKRVKGETSGDFERSLCAVLDPRTAGV